MLKTIPHKKLMPIYILNILKNHTDQDKHIRQKEIIKLLKDEFEIECERRAVARNIKYLVDAGFEIQYDKGYYIFDSEFSDCEISIIISTLLAAKYIPHNQKNSLINRLSSFSTKSFRSNLNYIKSVKKSGHQNKQFFYTVEILNQAILQNKKVKFNYNSYKCDKKLHNVSSEKYTVVPRRIIISNGWPYLLCNKKLLSFRIDYITDIEIVDYKQDEPNQVVDFDIDSYISKQMHVCCGESELIRFRAKKLLINDIIDEFENCRFIYEDDDYLEAEVCANVNSMLCWVLKYGADVEIISPSNLRKKISFVAQSVVDQYKKVDSTNSELMRNAS